MKYFVTSFNGKYFTSKTISLNNYSIGKSADITTIRYKDGKKSYHVSLYKNGNIIPIDVCDWKSAKSLAKTWIEG